jgi:hypothetical protein
MSKFGPSKWMKTATPVGYFRISDDKQDKSDRAVKEAHLKPILVDQFKRTNDDLKRAGLPQVKKANAFFEVASGTDRDRKKWLAARAKNHALTLGGKRTFLVVQDPSRFGRNTRHAFRALDEMHDEGVPVYAAREGIQTGSVGDLHPTEELIFVQLMGGASYVSQVQKEKADISVEKSKEGKGIMAGKGTSLFPFARQDPQAAFTSQLALFTLKPSIGGGSSAFKGTVAGMTAPHGPKFSAVAGMMRKDKERRAKLTDREHDAWEAYRTKIRNILIEREHDPWAKGTKAGEVDFGARALMRMAGRYIQQPWLYAARDDSEIQEYLENPQPYLSFDDGALWKSLVGHR